MGCRGRIFLLIASLAFVACGSNSKTGTSGAGETGGGNHGTSPAPVGGLSGKITVIPADLDPERWLQERGEALVSPGEVVMIAKESVTDEQVAEAARALGTELVGTRDSYFLARSKPMRDELRTLMVKTFETMSIHDEETRKTSSEQILETWHKLTANTRQLAQAFSGKGGLFSEVAPNYVRKPFQAPTDLREKQWGIASLGLGQIWPRFGRGRQRKQSIVAVVDSGVRMTHPNLVANLLKRPDGSFDGFDFILDPQRANDGDGVDGNPDDPLDTQASFHGTHVAGIVAATASNEFVIDGVAGEAKILPVRALGRDGGTDYDVAQGILYAAGLANAAHAMPSQRADVINLSLGGSAESPVLHDAIRRAVSQGVVVVAAAGNDTTATPSYPSAYPEVIAVGALKPGQRWADYSNFGPNVDVMAPGGGSPAMGDEDGDDKRDGILSTLFDPGAGPNGASSVSYMSGTSMAAPHVAGLIAIMRSRDPDLTVADVRRLIYAHLSPIDDPKCSEEGRCGRGAVSFEATLDAVDQEAAEIERPKPAADTGNDVRSFSSSHLADTFRITNRGTGNLRLIENEVNLRPTETSKWLKVTSVQKDNSIEISVQVDPLKVEAGAAHAMIDVVTNSAEAGGVAQLHAIYVKEGDPRLPSHVRVALLTKDRRVLQSAVATQVEKYAFNLSAPDQEGDFILWAGTAKDGGKKICTPGDLCGTLKGTLDAPATIHIKPEMPLGGLDFTIRPNYSGGKELEIR